MGIRTSREVTPLMLPQFYNLTDSDKGYEQSKLVPTSIEYAIVRLLLNLENTKQLLSLKDMVQDPLNSPQIKNTECSEFLSAFLEIHEGIKKEGAKTFNHSEIKRLSEKLRKILGNSQTGGQTRNGVDPFVQILTLFHFSANCVALSKTEVENSKGSVFKEIVNGINLSRIDSFDKAALLDHLYSDLFNLKKINTIKESPSERLEDLRMVANSGSLDFLGDITQVTTFYNNAIKPLLFSSGAISADSALFRLAGMYKSGLLSQLKKKHFDLNLASPIMLATDYLIMRYFNLGYNCSFGVLNLTRYYLANVKQCIVHVSYDGKKIESLRMTYTASVTLKSKKGGQVAAEETDRFSTKTSDLAVKLAGYHSQNDYINDYGYVIVVEKQGRLFYTTTKDTPLDNLLEGSADNILRVYFVTLNEMPSFNAPGANMPFVARVINRSKEHYMDVLSVAQTNKTYGDLVESSSVAFSVDSSKALETLILIDTSNTKNWYKVENSQHTMNFNDAKDKASDAMAEDIFVDPSLRPIELVIGIDFGTNDKVKKADSKWDQCQNSRYQLKPDCSDIINLLMKHSLDWNDTTQAGIQDLTLRTMLPNVLILPIHELSKYFEVNKKLSLPFLKECATKRKIRLPTEYNVMAYIGSSTLDDKAGFYYDMYRKSLENKDVEAFFEYEVKKLWDIQNPLIDINDREEQNAIIDYSKTIDELNFSKIKYVVLQQSL
jgi:hypothetical protein